MYSQEQKSAELIIKLFFLGFLCPSTQANIRQPYSGDTVPAHRYPSACWDPSRPCWDSAPAIRREPPCWRPRSPSTWPSGHCTRWSSKRVTPWDLIASRQTNPERLTYQIKNKKKKCQKLKPTEKKNDTVTDGENHVRGRAGNRINGMSTYHCARTIYIQYVTKIHFPPSYTPKLCEVHLFSLLLLLLLIC